MQTTFAVNMLALVDNQSQPKILSLRHILDEYLTFQEEIIVRRTKFDLKKALERAHLLEGLLIAEENIDEVIRIIRESYDDAKENLMQRFSLSDVQAQAILDMRLKALQGLEREKLQNEYDELEKRIAYFRELLADPEKVKAVLRDELIAIRDKYGDERKRKFRTSRTTLISKTSSRRSSACLRSRTAATSSACPSTSTPRKSAAARACARRRCATRTMWTPCSPPRRMTTFSSLPTAAAATARRATSSPRPGAPRAA